MGSLLQSNQVGKSFLARRFSFPLPLFAFFSSASGPTLPCLKISGMHQQRCAAPDDKAACFRLIISPRR